MKDFKLIKYEIKQLKLICPESFFKTDNKILANIVGGCGPGKFGDYLVPDTMYGLNISLACQIHDYEYATGETKEDKEKADINFLINLLKIIDIKSKFRVIKLLRGHRALSYYSAVSSAGDKYFSDSELN